MDLDDKAQNIVRLVDDNTLAKTDAKNQKNTPKIA